MDSKPSRPRRRWLRRLLIFTVLLAILLALAPTLLAPIVRGKLEAALAERTGGEVTIESLSLSWPGSATLEGLVLCAADGSEHARFGRAHADVDLRAAIGGRYLTDVEIEDWSVRATRREDGSWSLEDLLGPDEPDAAGEQGSPDSSEPPFVRAKIALAPGTLYLRTAGDVEEQAFTLASAVDFDGDALRVDSLRVDGRTLSGDITGRLEGLEGEELALREVEGDLTYVPDALGALLAPYIPGELTGTEPERLEFTFDGPVSSFALDDVLAGCSSRSNLGLGTFAAFGIEATGGVGVSLADGRLELGGQLEAAGGALGLDLAYDQDGARLHLSLDGARASAQLSPLLGELHPVFHGLDQLEGAGLDGLIAAELELAIDGPVSLSGLTEGFDLSKVRGRGTFGLNQGRLRGSPFLSQLLTSIGEPGETTLDLAPMSFNLDGGRLDYAERWRWAIDGVDTWFSGGLSLDGALDMAWEIPITRVLSRKHHVLEGLEGGSLKVPLRGTLADPKLDWGEALQGLAKRALEEKVVDELGLDDLLGGGDAEAILEEADRLWSAGKKGKAAGLYSSLRADHKISVVYLLNKSRIEERRRWKRE